MAFPSSSLGKQTLFYHVLIAESSISYDAEWYGDGLIGFTLPKTTVIDNGSTTSDSDKPAAKRRSTKATKS